MELQAKIVSATHETKTNWSNISIFEPFFDRHHSKLVRCLWTNMESASYTTIHTLIVHDSFVFFRVLCVHLCVKPTEMLNTNFEREEQIRKHHTQQTKPECSLYWILHCPYIQNYIYLHIYILLVIIHERVQYRIFTKLRLRRYKRRYIHTNTVNFVATTHPSHIALIGSTHNTLTNRPNFGRL